MSSNFCLHLFILSQLKLRNLSWKGINYGFWSSVTTQIGVSSMKFFQTTSEIKISCRICCNTKSFFQSPRNRVKTMRRKSISLHKFWVLMFFTLRRKYCLFKCWKWRIRNKKITLENKLFYWTLNLHYWNASSKGLLKEWWVLVSYSAKIQYKLPGLIVWYCKFVH